MGSGTAPAQGFQDNDGASPTIGFPVIGGTVNTLLYTDASGNLASVTAVSAGLVLYTDANGIPTGEAAFAYNASTNTLTVETMLHGNGTASAPSVGFTNFTTYGFYFDTSLGVVYTHATAPSISFVTAGVKFRVDGGVSWSSNTALATATDLAIFRKAAASLQLGATSSGSATNQTFGAHDTTGADKAGANLTIEAGNGTGTGGSGSIIFRTAPVAASSSTANTLATRWTIATAGGLTAGDNLRFAHGTSALATTATEGFFHMNSCAGAPTGVPASIPTGQIPMVFDTTNARLYFYHGAAWHYVAQTA